MRPNNPRNNIVGITFSTFDFFSAGHVKMLEEYEDKSFTGEYYCKTNGIQWFYNSRNPDVSSSNIRKKLSKAN
ncbi:MAG: hypothetical protein ACPHL7_05410 [Flavobacteriaceae bacterium]